MEKQKLFYIVLALLFAFVTTANASEVSYVDAISFQDETEFGLIDKKKPQAVLWGGHVWWIAGNDKTGLVLICDPGDGFGEYQFNSDETNKTVYEPWMGTYIENAPDFVYPNHYGKSDIRKKLQDIEKTAFSISEQKLMLSPVIQTIDTSNNSIYFTSDKLYLASGENKSRSYSSGYYGIYFTVGSSISSGKQIDKTATNNNLKISFFRDPFDGYRQFWIRDPYQDGNTAALKVSPGDGLTKNSVERYNEIIPVIELDLKTLLFASAAEGGKSLANFARHRNGNLNGYLLKFRFDGTDKIKSNAEVLGNIVKITKFDNETNLYLYIQWLDGIYSTAINNNGYINTSEIEKIPDLSECKIWLEKKEDNILYAKFAEIQTDFETQTDFAFYSNHENENENNIKNSSYIKVDDLKETTKFGLYNQKIHQAVYFGNHKWWIAGNDGNSLVLLCDPNDGFGEYFFSKGIADNILYDPSMGTYVESAPEFVSILHYGSSDIRKRIQELTDASFSLSEKDVMLEPTVFTFDILNEKYYFTKDYLYLPTWDEADLSSITLGGYNSNVIGNNKLRADKWLRVDLKKGPFSEGDWFWLRTPDKRSDWRAAAALPGTSIRAYAAGSGGQIIPAFNLDLNRVLFASAAEGAKDNALVDKDNIVTFRFGSEDKIKSIAEYSDRKICITIVDNEMGLYLYIQCDDGLYSTSVTKSGCIDISEIKAISDFDNSKIWLEKKIDNLLFAKIIN